MKQLLLPIAGVLFFFKNINAQLCPGGSTTFATAVTFNQSWILGCTTGTSCTGGTTLDNRTACEPTTSLDACAPGPTCTSATNGSDIWFSFFATGTTASIKVIQSVSFISVIQAYSGGPACGGLTQIGCAVAGGPSSGVTLNLTSLTAGQKYYYRVFGSASAAAQRTGTYCFCGSTGLGSSPLPIVLTGFTAEKINDHTVSVKWQTSAEIDHKYYILEHSTDGTNFFPLQQIDAKGSSSLSASYEYIDYTAGPGKNYYRLKIVATNGNSDYSYIVLLSSKATGRFTLFPNPVKDKLFLTSGEKIAAIVVNSAGLKVKTLSISTGRNEFSVADLQTGIYFIKTTGQTAGTSFNVIR